MDSNGICAQILMLRKRRGLTQAELGEKLGVSAKTVSKWETGRSYPDILLLPRLAAVFGVTVDALFAESANPLEAAPNALPYSSSPPKKTSCFLGSFAFAISTLSMLLPWILNKATLSFLYGACCSIFFSILAGILLHHFIAACRNSQLPCPHMRKWFAVASAAFAAHAAALGIVRLCASYRMDYAFTVLVAGDPVYGLVSSGIAAAAALWVWKRIP